jgi:hypothetical protein
LEAKTQDTKDVEQLVELNGFLPGFEVMDELGGTACEFGQLGLPEVKFVAACSHDSGEHAALRCAFAYWSA